MSQTYIKASCPSCGHVELIPSQVRIVACSVTHWSYYAFTCPSCNDEVRKPATPDVIELLVSGGVVVEPWHVPAEALEEHVGAVIDLDDVLDFALDLRVVDLLVPVVQAFMPPAVGT